MQELLREELAELLKLPGSSFKVELVMRLLGLSHARDTMIGSAMVGWDELFICMGDRSCDMPALWYGVVQAVWCGASEGFRGAGSRVGGGSWGHRSRQHVGKRGCPVLQI